MAGANGTTYWKHCTWHIRDAVTHAQSTRQWIPRHVLQVCMMQQDLTAALQQNACEQRQQEVQHVYSHMWRCCRNSCRHAGMCHVCMHVPPMHARATYACMCHLCMHVGLYMHVLFICMHMSLCMQNSAGMAAVSTGCKTFPGQSGT